MISMGTMWRKFKTNLTTKQTLAEDKNEDETPCDKYGIDPKNQEEFVVSHKTPSWQVKCETCFSNSHL